MAEKTTLVDAIEVSVVARFDNRVVTTMSTYVGTEPVGEAQRYDRKKKNHLTVPCPQSVKIYNLYMGGVDLLDAMLGFYRIKIRSKKWYLRIAFHILDLAAVNAWLLWKRANKEDMPLMEFKLNVAEGLCKAGKSTQRKRGRPNGNVQGLVEEKKKRGPTAPLPQQDVRLDGLYHFPAVMDKRQRCKYPRCAAKSVTQCVKCNVALCLAKERNCFMLFHGS